jgi:outer membrane protein, adhesin transport system
VAEGSFPVIAGRTGATGRRMIGVKSNSVAVRLFVLSVATLAGCVADPAAAGDGFSIFEAIDQAVATNPGVGEAAANRRATEAELRQSQGTLLPQVRLEMRGGPEKFQQQDVVPPPVSNNKWLPGRSGSIVIRQTLFDGFASLNEIWRHAARVDAAAYRVHERSELIALDAAEAYIDVVRSGRLIAIADENIVAHQRLLANVEARFSGGRAGEGDRQQARERVAAAMASRAEFRLRLEEARAAYRRAVGLEPFNLRAPSRLAGLPATRDAALATALQSNPTIQAAQADANASRHAFDATAGAFVPNVALEGRALRGVDSDTINGYRNEASGKIVLSWDVFSGGQDSWRRAAAAERYTEATMAHARLQRGAFESLDRAWAARTLTADRAAALLQQVSSDRRAIAAYQKEYELGQRSLIDLLNAQNQLYSALVSLESTRSVAIFADYQLLAAMGRLLAYLKAPRPADALPLEAAPLGIVPVKIAPVLIQVPKAGSEPLKMTNGAAAVPSNGMTVSQQRRPDAMRGTDIASGQPLPGMTPLALSAADAHVDARWPEAPSSALLFASQTLRVPVQSFLRERAR